MTTEIFFVLVWVFSGVLSILMGAAIFTYIRRTWQLIRADREGSVQAELLDAVDQVQAQLYSMSDRLERMERRLGPGIPGEEEPDPRAADERDRGARTR